MTATTEIPLRALGRGLAAGAVGTAVMTAAQTAYYKATGAEGSTVPADVAKRIIRGVLKREVSDEQTETLNTAMHWLYGIGWGALYGLAVRRPTHGTAFSAVVWGQASSSCPR